MHVTEKIIYDLFLFHLPLGIGYNAVIIARSPVRIQRRFQPRLYSAPEVFIPDAYGTKNRRRKPAPENGVD